MMNRTLEAFATRNTDSVTSDRGSGKSRKTFKKPKKFKDDADETWVDNLNDEREACKAILSELVNSTKVRGSKEG